MASFVDDYELGVEVLLAGGASRGEDLDEVLWSAISDPVHTEAVGSHARQCVEDLGRYMDRFCELIDVAIAEMKRVAEGDQ